MTPSFRFRPRMRIESVFVVAVLVAAATGVFRVLRDPAAGSGAPDVVARQFWIVVYAIVLVLAFRHRSTVWTVARQSPLVVSLLALALASTAWSADPVLTLQSATAVVITTLFGWYIVARYDTPGAVDLAIAALGITVLASSAAVVIEPDGGRGCETESRCVDDDRPSRRCDRSSRQ